MQKIGNDSFSRCSSLESIALPSTLAEVCEYAFCGCTSLREIIFNEVMPNIHEDAFIRCSSLERFAFPCLSTRMENVIKAGQIEIKNKLDDIQMRGSEINICTPAIGYYSKADWIWIKIRLDKIIKLITYYEMKEATTLFELALWKAKLEPAEVIPYKPYRYSWARQGCPIRVSISTNIVIQSS